MAEKLDVVLAFLNSVYNADLDEPSAHEHTVYSSAKDIQKGLKIPLHINEIRLIAEYLMTEKYLVTRNDQQGEPNYKITYSGKVFIENGGYAQTKKKEFLSNVYQTSYALSVGIGTALAGAYGLIQILHSLHCPCCH